MSKLSRNIIIGSCTVLVLEIVIASQTGYLYQLIVLAGP